MINHAETFFWFFRTNRSYKNNEFITQASTQVILLYFKHLRRFGKKQEQSHLEEKSGDDINVHDDVPSINNKMFLSSHFQ